jgi:hypothetical protein
LNARKKQKQYYSGKHKRHTLKAQVVIELMSGQFLAVAGGKGRTHDFRLLQQSKIRFGLRLCLADKGYQGIAKVQANSITPPKKPRRQALSQADKQSNRARPTARQSGAWHSTTQALSDSVKAIPQSPKAIWSESASVSWHYQL